MSRYTPWGSLTFLSHETGTLLYVLRTGAGEWRCTYLIKWRLVEKLILNITLGNPGSDLSLVGGLKNDFVACKVWISIKGSWRMSFVK